MFTALVNGFYVSHVLQKAEQWHMYSTKILEAAKNDCSNCKIKLLLKAFRLSAFW